MKTLAHSVPPTAARLPPAVEEDLVQVERRLDAELVAREERLRQIGLHLVGAGGKRVRPTVVLLTFHAVALVGNLARRADAIEAAVALELIHSATLLHDDIIDGGETRRGRPSALRTFGLADTLVAGDFIFSRAFALCARFEAEVVRWAVEACISLTEGEVMQGRFRHNPAVRPADYAEIIDRKTASLFEAGARTAAHLAGAAPTVIDGVARAGREIGLAFQVSDDLLDVIGDPSVTGKPRGIDLRDGNPSLPIVLGLQEDAELARLFARRDLEAEDVERGLGRLARSDVVQVVTGRVRLHVDAALEELGRLPGSSYRTALEGLAHTLVGRSG